MTEMISFQPKPYKNPIMLAIIELFGGTESMIQFITSNAKIDNTMIHCLMNGVNIIKFRNKTK